HWQVDVDRVAGRPGADDRDVAVRECQVDRLSVDAHARRLRGLVQKAIEIAGHRLVACPAGNAHVDGELARGRRGQDDLDGAVPGIAGFLNDLDGCARE